MPATYKENRDEAGRFNGKDLCDGVNIVVQLKYIQESPYLRGKRVPSTAGEKVITWVETHGSGYYRFTLNPKGMRLVFSDKQTAVKCKLLWG